MKYKYMNDSRIYEEKESLALRFLYNTIAGRLILKITTTRVVSKTIGVILNSRISIPMIRRYIKKYSIDMTCFENKKYKSFNEFFVRKKIKYNFPNNTNDFVSIANSKISCYKITNDLIINVKKSLYDINELIEDKEISETYKGGMCIIYRLSPSDYHRYIFGDNGSQKQIKKINGRLHTVNPISYARYKVFSENYREVTELNTDNFGKIIQIEVGALCVGKIVNNKVIKFNKFEEKGHFEFGGSTIIQLIKKDMIVVNKEIIENTSKDIETYVDIGQKIGEKCKGEK